MPKKQLTCIAIFWTRDQDSRKAILRHQLQQLLRIFAVGLLLLDALGFYRRWIADPRSPVAAMDPHAEAVSLCAVAAGQRVGAQSPGGGL